MLTLKIAAAVYVLGVAWMVYESLRNHYPLMLKRRGRNRPHWTAWADLALWPVWLLAGLSVMGGHALGEFADWVMRQVDNFGEKLMNPVFDFIDPPVEPARTATPVNPKGEKHE